MYSAEKGTSPKQPGLRGRHLTGTPTLFPSSLSANPVTHTHMAQIVDEYEGMLRFYNRKDERGTFFLHAK